MRSSFGSSRLVRLLGEMVPADAQAPGMDFAERLSLWLNAFDAMALKAAHQAIRGIRSAAPGQPADARPARALAIAEDVQRVRGTLAGTIARDPMGLAHAGDADVGYGPYHQRHLDLQRQMEQMIAPLRDHVRQALGRVSPALRQLAALDAVLEQVLTPREQMLLPRVGTLLKRRFEALRKAHRQEIEASGLPDDPTLWRQPGGWLDAFGQEWHQALLAELDLRLEPVLGLVDALGNELKNR